MGSKRSSAVGASNTATSTKQAEPWGKKEVPYDMYAHLLEGPFNFPAYAKKYKDTSGCDHLICKFCNKIYTGASRTSLKKHIVKAHFSKGELSAPGEDVDEWNTLPHLKAKQAKQDALKSTPQTMRVKAEPTSPKATSPKGQATTMWKCKFCSQTFPAGSITLMERHLVFSHSDQLGANSPLIARHQSPAKATQRIPSDNDDDITILPTLSGPINIMPQADQIQNGLSIAGTEDIRVETGAALKCRYCEARYTNVNIEELQEHLVTKHPDVIAQCLAGVPTAEAGQGNSAMDIDTVSANSVSPIASTVSPRVATLSPLAASMSPVAAILNSPVAARLSTPTIEEQLAGGQAKTIYTILPVTGESQTSSVTQITPDPNNDSASSLSDSEPLTGQSGSSIELSAHTIKMLKNKMLDYATYVDVVVDG